MGICNGKPGSQYSQRKRNSQRIQEINIPQPVSSHREASKSSSQHSEKKNIQYLNEYEEEIIKEESIDEFKRPSSPLKKQFEIIQEQVNEENTPLHSTSKQENTFSDSQKIQQQQQQNSKTEVPPQDECQSPIQMIKSDQYQYSQQQQQQPLKLNLKVNIRSSDNLEQDGKPTISKQNTIQVHGVQDDDNSETFDQQFQNRLNQDKKSAFYKHKYLSQDLTPVNSKYTMNKQDYVSPRSNYTHMLSAQTSQVFDLMTLKSEMTKMWNDDEYFTEDDLKYYEKYLRQEQKQKFKSKKSQRSTEANQIRWIEGKVLGTGAFGTVFEAIDFEKEIFMAVKQICVKDFINDENQKKELLETLELEISLLKELQHKNIVKYIGATKNKEKGSLNIFLELITQGSLSSVIQKYGKLNESQARHYMYHILKGLEYLHYHSIVHRDIKGANILLGQKGICKLSDFGSCKRMIQNKQDGKLDELKGTVNWMAPEAIKQDNVGRYSDIWSIGCTLIEMLTGELPFKEFDNQLTAIYQIGKGNIKPKIPSDISEDAKDFLKQCFDFDPKKRSNVRKLLKTPFISVLKKNRVSVNSNNLLQSQVQK